MSISNKNKILGGIPASVKWQVVRGDTASLSVRFYESDESTLVDTTGWSFVSTAYNQATQESFDLIVEVNDGVVSILAESDTTAEWSSGISRRSTELVFDLEVTKTDGSVWTPIRGTISVLDDVSGANL